MVGDSAIDLQSAYLLGPLGAGVMTPLRITGLASHHLLQSLMLSDFRFRHLEHSEGQDWSGSRPAVGRPEGLALTTARMSFIPANMHLVRHPGGPR